MAGYSGTPLPQKLGLKPGARFGIFAAPEDFSTALGVLPPGVTAIDAARGNSALDVVLCFAASQSALDRLLPRAHRRLDPRGGLWICWPKKASGIATDLTEAHVRQLGLARGLVDNKVCAIDSVWSGLRMVVRVAERAKASRATRVPAEPKTSRKTANPGAARAKKC